jgi:hypothetical protein
MRYCYANAWFSVDGRYRYRLTRHWDPHILERLADVFLNPSNAGRDRDDPTVRVFAKRAARLGYGGIEILNAFALVATDSAMLRKIEHPVGPENDAWLRRILARKRIKQIVVGWGPMGSYLDRDARVLELLRSELGRDVWVLGLTRHGYPRHPLRLGYNRGLVLWEP